MSNKHILAFFLAVLASSAMTGCGNGSTSDPIKTSHVTPAAPEVPAAEPLPEPVKSIDPVESFRSIFNKFKEHKVFSHYENHFIQNDKNMVYHHKLTSLGTLDVKKTDSLISPYEGSFIAIFDRSYDDEPVDQHQADTFVFTFQSGRWEFSSRTQAYNIVGGGVLSEPGIDSWALVKKGADIPLKDWEQEVVDEVLRTQ